MTDTEVTALAERVERTLDAASESVAQNKQWADRIRDNWNRGSSAAQLQVSFPQEERPKP